MLGTAFTTVRQATLNLDRLVAEATSHAEQIARTIAHVAHFEVAANDRVALAYRLEGFNHFEGVLAIAVLDRREALLAAAQRNPAGNLTATPKLPFATIRQESGNSLVAPPTNLLVRANIGEIAPIGWVYIEYQPNSLSAHRSEAVLNAAFILALLAIMAFLGWDHFRRLLTSSPA